MPSQALLNVIGNVRFQGPRSDVPSPGRRAKVVLLHVILAGGRIPRNELARRVWPESDPKSRSVLLYQARQRWRNATETDAAGAPLVFEGDDAVFQPQNLQVDVRQALDLGNYARALTENDTQIVAAVAEFVRLAGDQPLCADWNDPPNDLRATFDRFRIAVLDHGIAAATRQSHAEIAAEWTFQREMIRRRHPDLQPEGLPIDTSRPREADPGRHRNDDSAQAPSRIPDTRSGTAQRPEAQPADPQSLPPEVGNPHTPNPVEPAPFITTTTPQALPAHRRHGFAVFATTAAIAALAAALILASPGWVGDRPPTLPPKPLQVQWEFQHADSPDEADSEATDIAPLPGNGDGWVATGFVQTRDHDVDILTVRLGPDGKAVWRQRWSGKGHDCDRAFALQPLPDGGVLVAGETYVPEGTLAGVSEGWHLIALHYDRQGNLVDSFHSKAVVRNPDHAVKIACDKNGNVWIAATALVHGEPRFLAVRWKPGQAPAETTVGSRSGELASLDVGPDGEAVLVGTQRNPAIPGNPRDWAAVCLEPDGSQRWERRIDGHANSDDSGCLGLRDELGRTRVFGVLGGRGEGTECDLRPTVATLDTDTGAVLSLRRLPKRRNDPHVRLATSRRHGWDLILTNEAHDGRQVDLDILASQTGNTVASIPLAAPGNERVVAVLGSFPTDTGNTRGFRIDALVAHPDAAATGRLATWWVDARIPRTAVKSPTFIGDTMVMVKRSTGDTVCGQRRLADGRRRFFVWKIGVEPETGPTQTAKR